MLVLPEPTRHRVDSRAALYASPGRLPLAWEIKGAMYATWGDFPTRRGHQDAFHALRERLLPSHEVRIAPLATLGHSLTPTQQLVAGTVFVEPCKTSLHQLGVIPAFLEHLDPTLACQHARHVLLADIETQGAQQIALHAPKVFLPMPLDLWDAQRVFRALIRPVLGLPRACCARWDCTKRSPSSWVAKHAVSGLMPTSGELQHVQSVRSASTRISAVLQFVWNVFLVNMPWRALAIAQSVNHKQPIHGLEWGPAFAALMRPKRQNSVTCVFAREAPSLQHGTRI